VRDALGESLRSRRIAPKFHYASYKQAQLWMALHRSFSPAFFDPDCLLAYHRGFEAAAGLLGPRVKVIGLGCGDGKKEARLLALLKSRGAELSFVPCDVSLPLLLTAAAKAASLHVPCRPLLCDLALAPDLPEVFDSLGGADAPRILTFFGMIPNLEPEQIPPGFLARPADLLLLSANLAPGPEYRAGVERVLPGYDNSKTRAWLSAFLEDLGAEPGDGEIEFSIEETGGLWRIVGNFRFAHERELVVHSEHFLFQPGGVVRLFFSYRHTSATIRQLLRERGLDIVEEWITKSQEEGVFLCRRLVPG
jgi:uncharacterized SAM-dependent methyltransferase